MSSSAPRHSPLPDLSSASSRPAPGVPALVPSEADPLSKLSSDMPAAALISGSDVGVDVGITNLGIGLGNTSNDVVATRAAGAACMAGDCGLGAGGGKNTATGVTGSCERAG